MKKKNKVTTINNKKGKVQITRETSKIKIQNIPIGETQEERLEETLGLGHHEERQTRSAGRTKTKYTHTNEGIRHR